MPRFFFLLRNHTDVPDEEGSDLTDVEAARTAAIEAAREIMGDELKKGSRLPLGNQIEVKGETGETVFTVSFREAAGLESK